MKSDTFRTAVTNKISEEVTTLFYGKETRRGTTGHTLYKVSYRYYYTGREIEPGCCKDIILETRKDAEDVLSAVEDIFESYGLVTVADLCDLCSVTSSYKDNLIGWKESDSINRAFIKRNRNGYQLMFPKPVSLKMKGE